MSPILFALYLNDLHSFLRSRNVNGITVNENSDELLVYLRLLILLYADDTVLFSNSESDFQYSLDIFETYCKDWKLNINVSKSKVIVFGNIRGRLPEFKISGHILEIVEEYKYLVYIYPKLDHSLQLNAILQNKPIKLSTLSLRKVKH